MPSETTLSPFLVSLGLFRRYLMNSFSFSEQASLPDAERFFGIQESSPMPLCLPSCALPESERSSCKGSLRSLSAVWSNEGRRFDAVTGESRLWPSPPTNRSALLPT
uniref:Uncharacterized protein n=1 Tax=Euplotes harpa TaxID=151035 RepID=A0A7S3NAW5_9SPIT